MNTTTVSRPSHILIRVLALLAAMRGRRTVPAPGFGMLVAALLCCLAAEAFAQAPANDNFANSRAITGYYGSTTGTNANATMEVGEPARTAGNLSGRSVWFDWTAPVGGSFTFGLAAGFNFQMAIYTGSAVNSLASRGEIDVADFGVESITLAATGGTVYRIRVAGSNGASGPYTLNWNWNVSPVYEKVYSFTDARAADYANKGSFPNGPLAQGPDGLYYGTTSTGGATGSGTVFKMTPAGVMTTLVEFTDNGASNKGSRPHAGLVLGSDGNFYGSTQQGGTTFNGTIFKMTPAGVLTTLVNFTGNGAGNKGKLPSAGLVQGSDGNFYGTTLAGGASDQGTVFRMSSAGVLTTLAEFTGNGAAYKGGLPRGGLVQGGDGNFYGTTEYGGGSDNGTIYKITPSGTLTTLVQFSDNGASNKGRGPDGVLVLGTDGNFYGTTVFGGAFSNGTVFKMTPAGVLTTLVEFTGNGAVNKGQYPHAGLFLGSDGNFYGTTGQGGATSNGTVFKMTPAGMLMTLLQFTGNAAGMKGSRPAAGLVQGSDGNLYGMTEFGGAGNNGFGYGTVFKMTTAGLMTTLVEFTGNGASAKGLRPTADLVQGADGNFYGTTQYGGSAINPSGYGTVFKMTPAGVLTTLVEFTDNGAANKGSEPVAGLTRGTDGNFYGTTLRGGAFSSGTIFKVTPGGVLTTLVEFTGNGANNKGGFPVAGLVVGSDGDFYGSTINGGAFGYGTIFKVTPAGVLTTLVEFTGNGANNKGNGSHARLVLGSDGNFYGTSPYGGALGWGTVFKMTPAGVLTTLLEFTNNGASNKGSSPNAGLVQGSDGFFYGTTTGGGASGLGTLFRVSSTGVLTTLVAFNNSSIKGQNPDAGLALGNDGNFYGTTKYGGASDQGTLFKMSPTGLLTTLVEFTTPEDGHPSAVLIGAGDGSLFGTTEGPDGAIYRLIFSGAPNVFALEAEVQGTSSVLCQARVNARGAITGVTLEYGTNGVDFPNIVPIASALGGFQTTLVGTTLDNLSPGTNFFYRFRATSSLGTTIGPDPAASFSTLAEPIALAEPATEILPTSARFNGTVNARNYPATVAFEFGTDGDNFPFSLPVVPATVTGNTGVPVSAAVAGLAKGTIYFYRVVANNAAGTTVSGTESFTTLTDPVATVAPPTAVTSQGAVLHGSVNAKGSPATVIFEYGTDGVNFPIPVEATPPTVTGDQDTAVTANLSGLAPGTPYYYRVKATSLGGTGYSGFATLSLDTLSGFTQVMPGAPPAAQGFLLVNLTPAGVGGWRFTGEQGWRPSGVPAGGLTTSDRVIEFLPVDSYLQPDPEPVTIVSGGAPSFVARAYQYVGQGGGSGGINVVIKPDSLADPDVPEAKRAQWRLSKLGVNNDPWLDSGYTLGGLQAGNYLVEFKPIVPDPGEPERATPRPAPVVVDDNLTSQVRTTYFLKDTQTGVAPTLVPFETISGDPDLPYRFVGQIRSDSGSSTGFVVKPRVVATAGHVVFDDATLSVVTGLQWLFQRDSATHEPKPLIPRGVHLLDNYAAARSAPGAVPGVGTPESQNRDAAAMFFGEDAGRGGYSGFLASDATPNEFLASNAEKTLAGYPVDGAAFLPGRMHATASMDVHLQRVNATDASGVPFRTYTTADIRGVGGMSGGPLCVRFASGYYPAAIYLGGSNQTVVRAIDSTVIDIFNRAELSAIAGENSTGGGITLSTFSDLANSPSGKGLLKVSFQPNAIRTLARWRIAASGSYFTDGHQEAADAGTHSLQLLPVAGYQVPDARNVTIIAGKLREIVFEYVKINAPPTLSNVAHQTTAEDTPTAAIPFTVNNPDGSETSLAMSASSSNTNLVPVANIAFGGSGANRTVTLTPAADQSGTATITLTVRDGSSVSASDTFVLTVTPVNDPPTITFIGNQNPAFNASPSPLAFAIGDSDTPVGSLTLAPLSSNPSFVPLDSIVFGGSGTSRNVTVTPASGQLGSSSITVNVSDGSLTASRIFSLTVTGNALEIWRFARFGTAANTGAAADTADPDSDGSPNLDEYTADTDPANGADCFKISASSRVGNAFSATLAGKTSRTYVLERRDSLASGPWTPVATAGPLATAGPVTLTDPATPATAAFYHIKVSVP